MELNCSTRFAPSRFRVWWGFKFIYILDPVTYLITSYGLRVTDYFNGIDFYPKICLNYTKPKGGSCEPHHQEDKVKEIEWWCAVRFMHRTGWLLWLQWSHQMRQGCPILVGVDGDEHQRRCQLHQPHPSDVVDWKSATKNPPHCTAGRDF